MRMLLNGAWVERQDVIEVRNPQDGELIDTVPKATPEDMEAAVQVAVQSAAWARRFPVHRRMDTLRRAAESLCDEHETFSRTIAQEGIKTIREARKEVTRCIETLRLSAEEARRISGETIAFDQMPGSERRKGFYQREPVGVIGAITPFNDPLNLVAHKLGPALAAGNAVILKPDSKTPLSGLKLVAALDDAGLPPGVLQALTGDGAQIGNTLVAHPRVRMISFTGGLQTGKAIMKKAGLKKVCMELGSNAPAIIMGDANLDQAVSACVSGGFWAAGQNCLHVQRILIHEEVYEPFKDQFLSVLQTYRVGDKLDETTDMGPMINEAAALHVERLVNDAVQAGARLLTGGTRTGTFYAPTVLEEVPDTCSLSFEEIYGPVVVFESFSSPSEAVKRANAVDYGLQSGVFTQSLETALLLADELHCGGVMINDSSDYRIDAMPFGGVKGSGLGREGVRFAIQEMTEPKVVCFNLIGEGEG